ncbi:MAG: MSMEG_4193 family putative phosphomutase [Anaerolineae bacterium]
MSEETTRLLLIRHAHNDYLDTKRLAGRTPGVHLNEKGRQQAQALAGRLSAWPITAIYSSPMERALETAAPLAAARGLAVQILDDLNETDCGEWTGQAIEELIKTEIWLRMQSCPSTTPHPGGEGIVAVQTRMVRALDALRAAHRGELIAVFSHADPIKAALAHYTGLHIDLFQRLVIDPAAISELAFWPQGPRLIRCNDTAHVADGRDTG